MKKILTLALLLVLPLPALAQTAGIFPPNLTVDAAPAADDVFPVWKTSDPTHAKRTSLSALRSGLPCPAGQVLAAPTLLSGPLVCRALVATDLPSLASLYLPLSGGTLAGNLTLTPPASIVMPGAIVTPAAGSANGLMMLGGSGATQTSASNEGDIRPAMISLYPTDPNDVSSVGLSINMIQRNNPGAVQIGRSGIHIRAYTQPDNGGDTSGMLVLQTGGGSGISIYKLHQMRPPGFTNYSSSLQGAAEFGTGDQNFAALFISGAQLGGASTDSSQAIVARADNPQSRGIVVYPSDGVFDSRWAYVVGIPQINANPVQVKAGIDMGGNVSGQSLNLGASNKDSTLVVSNNVAATLPAPAFPGATVLHIAGPDASAARITVDASGGNAAAFDGRVARGTLASPSAILLGDTIVSLNAFGYGATGYSAGGRAAMQLKANENWSDAAQGTREALFLTPVGSTTIGEKFSFDGAGHMLGEGPAPAVACTGTGTSPAAPTIVGGDLNFTITVNTGTGSPGSTGTCTVTFATAFATNIPVIVCSLVKGATAWGNGATVQLTTESLSAPILTWANLVGGTATALTVSTSYKINCLTIGR